MKTGAIVGIIVGVIILFIGGIIIGTQLDKEGFDVIYPKDRTQFTVESVSLTAIDMEGLCFSRLSSLVPDFERSGSIICNQRAFDNGINFDVLCDCYSYTQIINTPDA
jgi:hypothetical protein